MAARGYIVIAPDSETGLRRAQPPRRRPLALAALGACERPRGKRNPRCGRRPLHGGGAALVAADRHPAIDTVFTLAAAETTPSATTASAGVAAPALYVVGTEDGIVAPATTRAMFTVKPPPATFAAIVGGYHCGFTDSSAFFGLGCDSGSISRATQLALTHRLLGDWLDARFRAAAEPARRAGVVITRK